MRYSNPPGTSNYFTWFPVGSPSRVQFHPNTACGTTTLTIRNKATAALYYYTPYQPNAAALSNLYGTGDACSSYGNRNFWRMYSDWFGSPTGGSSNPTGNWEAATASLGRISLSGWMLDPDKLRPDRPPRLHRRGVGWRVHGELHSDGCRFHLSRARERPRLRGGHPGPGGQVVVVGVHLRIQRRLRREHLLRVPDGAVPRRVPVRERRGPAGARRRRHRERVGARSRHVGAGSPSGSRRTASSRRTCRSPPARGRTCRGRTPRTERIAGSPRGSRSRWGRLMCA